MWWGGGPPLQQITIEQLRIKEDKWRNLINPSYNVQSILNPFLGKNHYRYGKTVSQETRQKISNTLYPVKGLVKSELTKGGQSKSYFRC